MEQKEPLTRESSATTTAEQAKSALDDYSWVPWVLGCAAIVLLFIGIVIGRVSKAYKPAAVAPLSTRQALVPVEIGGCSYWFCTFGEPTNANFAVSLTHSGSCTNWQLHQALMK